MSRIVHFFDNPERFVVGTVGLPGDRTFFIQVRHGSRIISVALEKEQVSLLAERIDELLDQVTATEGINTSFLGPADLEPMDNPIAEEFRVGTLSLGWNSASKQVVIEAHASTESMTEVPDLEQDSDVGPDVVRVRILGAYARAFVSRAFAVIGAGRPPCPLCGEPLDPRGHICVRANGYRRRG